MSELPWLGWMKWQEIKKGRQEASQAEMEDPGDFEDPDVRDELYRQACPSCSVRSVFTRTGQTLTFPRCGHGFRVPRNPEDVSVTRPVQHKGTAAYLHTWDEREGTITFDDGTTVAVRQFAWTNFPALGQYGEERWQLTTTMPRRAVALLPTGEVGIESIAADGKAFAVKRAIVEVADEEQDRPVITIQWRPADAPEGPGRCSRIPDPVDAGVMLPRAV